MTFRCEVHGVIIEMPFAMDNGQEKFGIVQCEQHLRSGVATGGWEQCERDRTNRFLPDTNVIEFGGGTGFLSCFTNKLIGADKKHIVYEANPILKQVIEHNRDINGCNFEVVTKAYHGSEKLIDYLVTNPHDNIASLQEPVTFRIEAVNLGDIVREYGLEEYALVMDVEGYEIGLVNESEALKKCRSIIIEIHRSGAEAGGRGFDDSINVHQFLLDEGFTLLDRCPCIGWVGAYERQV